MAQTHMSNEQLSIIRPGTYMTKCQFLIPSGHSKTLITQTYYREGKKGGNAQGNNSIWPRILDLYNILDLAISGTWNINESKQTF